MSNSLAIRVFNRTKFMQVMKHSFINYWGATGFEAIKPRPVHHSQYQIAP